MKVDVTRLVLLAWNYAGYESAAAGDSHIRPVHLLMGLTKIADYDLEKLNLAKDELAVAKEEQASAIAAFGSTAISPTALRRFLRARLWKGVAAERKPEMMHRDREAKNAFLAGRLRCAGQPCTCAGLTWALANGQNLEMAPLLKLAQVDSAKIVNAAGHFLPAVDSLDEAFDRSIARITYPLNFPDGEAPWELWLRRAHACGLNNEPLLSSGMLVIKECLGKCWNEILWIELDLENRGDGMIFSAKRSPARCTERWAALLDSSGERSALPRQPV